MWIVRRRKHVSVGRTSKTDGEPARSAVIASGLCLLFCLSSFTTAVPQTDADQPGIRWLVSDEGVLWVPHRVAIGDSGASTFAGLIHNGDHFAMFAGGSPEPVFEVFPPEGQKTLRVYVDMAKQGSLAASVSAIQVQSPPADLIVSELSVYDDFGTGHPAWSFRFAGSTLYTDGGQGVRISRSGDVVLGWSSSTQLQGVQVEAFTGEGTSLSSALLYPSTGQSIQFVDTVDLSDAGSRALLFEGGNKKVIIYDVATGDEEFTLDLVGAGSAHALSGDGLRFASGENNYFIGNSVDVWERGSGGSWSEVLHLAFPYEYRVWLVDLDRDGSRVAFALQHESLESFRVVLYDLDSASTLFDHVFDAPGTALQNVVSDLCVDDAGQTVAGTTWGDSLNLTPEVFVFDEDGTLLRAIDTTGSGRTIDITPEGDLVIAGCKRGHANLFAPGGDVLLIETRPMRLHVLGLPRAGGEVVVQIEGQNPSDVAFLGVAGQLLEQPQGALLLDLSGPHVLLPPLAVGTRGLETAFRVPVTPALVGVLLHVQAVVVEVVSGTDEATNKVSLRMLPRDT